MRKIYDYLTVEQKKETIKHLLQSLEQLNEELKNNGESFSPFIKEILLTTKDRWSLEIEELQYDIKHNIGPRKETN